MLVKICGITTAEDAAIAVDAGASAIGFVFWPESPRWIDPYRAARISAALPPFVTPVGVFVNQPPEYVNGVAALVRLGAVQLHGDERPADAGLIKTPVIKSFTPAANPGEGDEWGPAVTLLLDVHDPVRRGGTGHTIDWSAAARVAARRPVLLAGGLAPENVADAIVRVGPYGIDVSSGVECEPGRKDASRVRALFDEIRRIARQ